MATLRQLAPLIALLDDEENLPDLSIGPELTSDLIYSMAYVGGSMWVKDGETPTEDLTIAAGWNRIDVWNGSRDTKGVQDGLNEVPPEGWYKVKKDADGIWRFAAKLRAVGSAAGKYQIRVAQIKTDDSVNGQPYQDEITTSSANEEFVLAIGGGLIKDMVQNEKLQLEIKGPNGSVVTVTQAQFEAERRG